MGEGVAELMPPIFTNDFRRVDFVLGPKMAVACFVEENGLEDVIFKGDGGWELRLVICTVEAHFKFCEIFGIHFDIVLEPHLAVDSVWMIEFAEETRGLPLV